MFSSKDHRDFMIIAYTGLLLACIGILSIVCVIGYGVYRIIQDVYS